VPGICKAQISGTFEFIALVMDKSSRHAGAFRLAIQDIQEHFCIGSRVAASQPVPRRLPGAAACAFLFRGGAALGTV
jgi:hypothetical protein